MAFLREFNQSFAVDVDKLKRDSTLIKMIENSPREILFHLECAVAAFDNESSLRYLPHPNTYLTKRSFQGLNVKGFIDFIRGNLETIYEECKKSTYRTDSGIMSKLSRFVTNQSVADVEKLL